MPRRMVGSLVLALVLVMLVAACDGLSGSEDGRSGSAPRIAITPTPPTLAARASSPLDAVAQQPTATSVSLTPTPAQLKISVWWPDELYPADGSVAESILSSQFESFRLTYSAYSLEVRRKRASGLGGILSTLRAAEPVAPGALPDLTLMRRSDMITAATEGLIVPLNDWIPTDLAGPNLFPGVAALGEIDGQLYGLPYALNVYHTVYRATVFDAPLVTFADVLAADPTLLFPVNHSSSSAISLTVLLQYLAAGGQLVDANGSPTLVREPLMAVLSYYEQAAARGILDESLLQYTEAEDYWSLFANAQANVIGVDAWTYLRHKDLVPNTGLAPIPTLEGTPITALEGWMWVLTTQDPDRQNQARAFLSWMMRVSQQSLFTEAEGVLPSQQRALALWDDDIYANFAETLVMSGTVIPLAQRTGSAAIALQEALVAVLQGTPAADAADTALAPFVTPGS